MGGPRRHKGVPHKHEARSSAAHFSPRFFLPREVTGTWAPAGLPDGALSPGARVALSEEDSHHALRVLRLRIGDDCEVVGAGAIVYRGVVSAATCPLEVTLVEALTGDAAGPVYRLEIGLAQALVRPAVMDYVLEKGTEVGADFFLLVQAEGSPRSSEAATTGRLERWRRIAREAAKQSKQTRVPWVTPIDSVDAGLRAVQEAGRSSVILDPEAPESLPEVLDGLPARARVCLWIGPEGGWAAAESESFRRADVSRARLGRSILRTETAGPVAMAIARLALGDW